MNKTLFIVCSGLICSLVIGCATSGTVVVRSEPPNAKVYYLDSESGQNALIGETPLTFVRSEHAKGKEVIQLRVEKDGFEPRYSAVASFGGETTYVDLKLASVAVASAETRKAFELSRDMMTEANRLAAGKRFSEALTRVEKVIEVDPKNADAHAARGSILYLMKDPDGAKQSWTRALELNPGFESVRSSLMELNLGQSQSSSNSQGETP